MLTAAQKHRLIKEFTEDRNQKHEEYKQEKEMRKTGTGQYQPNFQNGDEEEAYTKLYKNLGTQNRNKDLRNAVKEHLEERDENKLGPGMWLTLNPQYRLDENNFKSTFQENFTGLREEPVDKIYFRKKDEQTMYAECYLKSKKK